MTSRPHAATNAALLVLAVFLRLKGMEPIEMDLALLEIACRLYCLSIKR